MAQQQNPSESKKESDSPLKSYLNYYKKLENPGYAVLITGDWGSGKTYQVKKVLEPNEYYLVSLFGLCSDSDVYGAVFAQMFPEADRTKRLAKWFDGKNVGALGVTLPFGSILAAAFNATVRQEIDNSRILIFDDLERSNLKPKILLGIINNYVEHYGCRVLVIADDEKIVGNFNEAKEKIFGQTIRIVPQIEEAFKTFLSVLDQRTIDAISKHELLLKEVFRASRCQSLRVLKHSLADLGRLCSALTNDQLHTDLGVKDIIALFTALSIDLRWGKISRSDLLGRQATYWQVAISKRDQNGPHKQSENNNQTQAIVDSHERYKAVVDVTSNSLDDELLVEMLVDGKYDRSAIQNYVQTLPEFQDESVRPLWWKFWQYRTKPAAEVHQTIKELDEKFLTHGFVELGEVLHVFSIQFYRIEFGWENWPPEETEGNAKQYLNKLVELGCFPIVLPSYLRGGHISFGGYSINFPNKYIGHYSAIRKHIDECQKQAWKRNSDNFKNKILSWLHNDVDELRASLNQYDRQSDAFHNIPVLLSIEPHDFVKEFLTCDIKTWGNISGSLVDRKDRARHNGALANEMDWFAEVDRLLVAHANNLEDPIAKKQILQARPISDAEREAETQVIASTPE
jgi:hypothetical protein